MLLHYPNNPWVSFFFFQDGRHLVEKKSGIPEYHIIFSAVQYDMTHLDYKRVIYKILVMICAMADVLLWILETDTICENIT